MTTTTRRLIVVVYPTVEADVSAMLADGKSWRDVAAHVSDRAGVAVSHEFMRQWFGSERVA